MNISSHSAQQLVNAVKQFNNIRLILDRAIIWALSNPIIQILIH